MFDPDGNQSETLCNRALGAAKKSVQLAPQRWQHWNQLGIIAALPGTVLVSLKLKVIFNVAFTLRKHLFHALFVCYIHFSF